MAFPRLLPYLGTVLAKLLKIAPEDRRDTAVAFGTLFCILAGHAMLETAIGGFSLMKGITNR